MKRTFWGDAVVVAAEVNKNGNMSAYVQEVHLILTGYVTVNRVEARGGFEKEW